MGVREKLSDMKEDLKNAQDNYNRNKGVYDSKLQELKKDFGFKNLDEAKEAIIKMKKKVVVMQKRFDESI